MGVHSDPHHIYDLSSPGYANSTQGHQVDGANQESANDDDVDTALLLGDYVPVGENLQEAAESLEGESTTNLTPNEKQGLEEYGTALINAPGLPPGAKASLQRWLSALQSDPTTATTAAAQAPQGASPTLLQMTEPGVSATTKGLGDLASAMAAGQGGTLTASQVAFLTSSANDLLANPNLSPADHQALENFMQELSDYPISGGSSHAHTAQAHASTVPVASGSDEPVKAGSNSELNLDEEPSASAANAGVADQAPDGAPVNEGTQLTYSSFSMTQGNGVSSDVQDLGTQGAMYEESNGGTLTAPEIAQLSGEAQTLLSNPNISAADKSALEAFLSMMKGLVPGPSTDNSGLLLTQAGTNPELIELAQLADSLFNAQGGTLTQNQMQMLVGMANALMSKLSPSDQAMLNSWLDTLNKVPVKAPPPLSVNAQMALIGGGPPEKNPYLEPGIMAMLAPILAELFAIYADIIRQSSKLKQAMFALLTSMAKDAYNYAMASGKAQANILANEATKYEMLGITAALGAGAALASFGAQKFQEGIIQDGINSVFPKANVGYTTNAAGERTGVSRFGGISQEADIGRAPTDANLTTAQKNFQTTQVIGTRAQTLTSTFLGNFFSQLSNAAQSFISADYTRMNVSLTIEQASDKAMSDMITQLMAIVQQTMQSSSDEMAAAQKNWESFVQLYQQFAQTISQSFYQHG